MGHTIEVDEKIYKALVSSVGEEFVEKRLSELLSATIVNRLEDYTRGILKFEGKYGVSFLEFERLWDSGALENRHSYEIESDYIDWEMLEMEKKELLTILSNLNCKQA